jgi:hypothetical protein
MPAQAGIQLFSDDASLDHGRALDSGFRRNDEMEADFEVTCPALATSSRGLFSCEFVENFSACSLP